MATTTIPELKKAKRVAKANMTKVLTELSTIISETETDKAKVKTSLERVEELRKEVLAILEQLEAHCEESENSEMAKQYGDEYEQFNDKIDRETSNIRIYLSKTALTQVKEIATPEVMEGIGTLSEGSSLKSETHRQLERIRIPVFNGDKLKFQQWFAAFTSCIDKTSMDPQFKMLRLESCLEGEAAETVKGLGYSEVAYEAAKKRLIRKRNRRNVQAHLDELRRMKQISEGSPKELEKFADILERTVVTLKENKRESDLRAGTLYGIVLEKVPEMLLSQYYRWLKEKMKEESLETLNCWIAEEAEYQTQAAESKRGFGREKEVRKGDERSGRKDNRISKSFGTSNEENNEKKAKPCVACGEKHPIWKCLIFKAWSGDKKWETAKRAGLCYRCLGDNHLGKDCKRSRVCPVTGCNKNHHHLLHEVPKEKPPSKDPPSTTEGDAKTEKTTMETVDKHEGKSIALRTVPVILKNGKKRLLVNCFLDEGSDTTYVNEDVVEQLGLQQTKEPVTVQVANAQQVSFMSRDS